MRRFREPQVGDRHNVQRCPRCWIRINMPMPYCSQVCDDSNHAHQKRETESILGISR